MAGNLTGLHVFANDVSPEPLSLLDTNYSAINTAFNALANFANYYVDSGVANAMAITVTANQTVSYNDGLYLQVQVAATNTGATTLNVNALGSKNVVDQGGNALTAGQLLAGTDITVIYRSVAGNFQLIAGAQYQNWATGGSSLKGTVTISAPTVAPHLLLAEGPATPVNTIQLGTGVNGRGAVVQFLGASAAQTAKNWLIGNQNNLSDTLEFTPSTTNGGSTFTTPAMKITGSGNVTVNAPASGIAVTVNGLNETGWIEGAASTWSGGFIAGATNGLQMGSISNNAASIYTNNITRLLVAAAGNVTINTPASGTALTVNSVTTGLAQVWNDSVRNFVVNFIAQGAQIGFTTVHDMRFITNNTQRMAINSTGNVSFSAPASGVACTATAVSGQPAWVINASTVFAVQVNGAAAGTPGIQFNTVATTGAQTATFSATNKPGSGTTSPSNWIPFNLDGTVYYVPAWQ